MHFIITLIDSEKYEDAHRLFLIGFNSLDKSFDVLIVNYIKQLIFLIADEFENLIIKSNPSFKKRTNKADTELPEDINIQFFVNNKNEATKMAIQLVPIIFNVELDIYILDGSISKEDQTIKYSKVEFKNIIEEEKPPKTKINLLYNLNKFDIIYKESQKSRNLLNIEEVVNPYTYTKEPQKCSRCSQVEKFVCIPYYQIMFCYGCSFDYIDIMTTNRISYMNKENYHSREFYGRPIEVIPNYPIGDSLFIEIYKENIINILQRKLKKMCYTCDELKDKKDLLIFEECNCQYCHKCLDSIVKAYTKNHYILNKIEKLSYERPRCACNGFLNCDLALSLLKVDVTEHKESAFKRQSEYAETKCMTCVQNYKNSSTDADDPDYAAYKKIKISQQKKSAEDTDISFVSHLICMTCIDKIREIEIQNEFNNHNQGHGNDLIKELHCEICQVTHLIEKEEWKRVFSQSSCECNII